MKYRCIASSPEGLIQQVAVCYLRHGYWWYSTGRIPDAKDPTDVDRKLVAKYGIAFETDRVSPAIVDLFLSLERMMAFRHQQQKPVLVTDVLHVRESSGLAGGSLPFGDVDSVFGDEFSIDFGRIFRIWDSTGDVPPIAMSQVADGDLLNESFGAAGDASVLHAND